MSMSRRRGDTEEAAILRALAASPRGSLLTPALLSVVGGPQRDDLSPTELRQRRLTRLGNELRRLEQRGMTERAGQTAGAWQSGPVQCWRITPAGREQVTWWEENSWGAELAAQRAAEVRARQAERERKQGERRILLAQAGGLRLHRIERQQKALELREAGCTYREIGEALGVTAQAAYLDVTLPTYQNRPGRKPEYRIAGPRGRPLRMVRQLENTPLAGLVTVTFTEW